MTRPGRIREYAFRFAMQLGVIVLGVTMALWADEWAAKRKDRATEAARLGALKQNVENTLENLRAQREDAAGSANALRTLLAMTGPGTGSEEIRSALLSQVSISMGCPKAKDAQATHAGPEVLQLAGR